jgi:acetaldehyde dehydrogenase (acetylating)
MWNPFAKDENVEKELEELARQSGKDVNDLGVMEKFAMKRLAKMSPAEREKVMRKAMTPKNIQKNKTEILASLEAMRKAKQISDDQYRLAKKRFGL